MSEPDILLGDRDTTIVQQLQLVTEEGGEPTITVDPFDEQLLFGQIEQGQTRSEISPELVESDELRSEEIGLGGGQTYQKEGRCRVYRGGNQDLDPRLGVEITGGGKSGATDASGELNTSTWPAGIVVYDDGERGTEIGPESVTAPSSIQVGTTRGPTGEGPDGPPTKDGSEDREEPDPDYVPGEIDIKGDSAGEDGQANTAVEIRGASEDREGSNISLYDTLGRRTADLDAWEARLTLGQVGLNLGGDFGGSTPGVDGKLSLVGGSGTTFDVTASDGTLTIETDGEGAVFEIDTGAGEIRTKYDISEGVL